MTLKRQPRAVSNMHSSQYHAHPALSSTGARKLLAPGCPARFLWEKDNPPTPTRALNMGQAVHDALLCHGHLLVDVDADTYRTKAAQAVRDAAYDGGDIPLLRPERAQLDAMVKAVRQHEIARVLLDPSRGEAELSLFWSDERTGRELRARLDWLRRPNPLATPSTRYIIVDYKTAKAADLDACQRAMYDHGYHMQAAWYTAAVRHVFPEHPDPAFVFIFQEKTEPYLVTLVEPNVVALRIGDARNREAIDVWDTCLRTGSWPGHGGPNRIHMLGLPVWAEIRELEDIT